MKDPYRHAHPRRTDWLRLALTVGGALLLSVAIWAALGLAIVYLG